MKNKIGLKIRDLFLFIAYSLELIYKLVLVIVTLPIYLTYWFFNDKTLKDSFKTAFNTFYRKPKTLE